MSESPDIPALIESLQIMEDLNDLPLKPRHRRTLRGAIDALAALSVSQPTTASSEETVSAAVVLAALDSMTEEWTLHPRAEASAMKASLRKLRDQVANQARTPSVPLAVTVEQIEEAREDAAPVDRNAIQVLRDEIFADMDNAKHLILAEDVVDRLDRILPRSGGAPTAQQVPSELRSFVSDLAKHGVRFDLNPTVNTSRGAVVYVEYIERIDKSIRERAAAVLPLLFAQPATQRDEKLRAVWSALGCAPNPDDFKPTVQAKMWESVLEMITQATKQTSSVHRENQGLRELIAKTEWEYRAVASEPDTHDVYDSTRAFPTPSEATDWADEHELLQSIPDLPQLVLSVERRRKDGQWEPVPAESPAIPRRLVNVSGNEDTDYLAVLASAPVPADEGEEKA